MDENRPFDTLMMDADVRKLSSSVDEWLLSLKRNILVKVCCCFLYRVVGHRVIFHSSRTKLLRDLSFLKSRGGGGGEFSLLETFSS